MSATGDIFQAELTEIAGIVRAGNVEITFTADETTYELAALGLTVSYSQEIRARTMSGGKLLLVLNPATGAFDLTGLIGTDLTTFIEYFGDPCNIDNSLVIEMSGEISCTSPSLQETINAYESATLTLKNVLISSVTLSSRTEEILVTASVRGSFYNLQWTLS